MVHHVDIQKFCAPQRTASKALSALVQFGQLIGSMPASSELWAGTLQCLHSLEVTYRSGKLMKMVPWMIIFLYKQRLPSTSMLVSGRVSDLGVHLQHHLQLANENQCFRLLPVGFGLMDPVRFGNRPMFYTQICGSSTLGISYSRKWIIKVCKPLCPRTFTPCEQVPYLRRRVRSL